MDIGIPRSENAKRWTIQRVKKSAKRRMRDFYRKSCDNVIFNTIGYVVNRLELPFMLAHRPDFHVDYARMDQYGDLFRGWVRGNHANNAGDLTRLYLLFLNLDQVMREQVPGDFVELGVYKGNSAVLLARAARRNDRQLYLFDTFEGFDRRDLNGVDSTILVQFRDTSLTAVRSLVGEDHVNYVQGFFPESADRAGLPEHIAIAHIDCDLYEPMKAALERFYPLMSPGGLMLMHDYASGHWQGTTQAVDAFFADKPEKPVIMPDKSGTAAVRIMERPVN